MTPLKRHEKIAELIQTISELPNEIDLCHDLRPIETLNLEKVIEAKEKRMTSLEHLDIILDALESIELLANVEFRASSRYSSYYFCQHLDLIVDIELPQPIIARAKAELFILGTEKDNFEVLRDTAWGELSATDKLKHCIITEREDHYLISQIAFLNEEIDENDVDAEDIDEDEDNDTVVF